MSRDVVGAAWQTLCIYTAHGPADEREVIEPLGRSVRERGDQRYVPGRHGCPCIWFHVNANGHIFAGTMSDSRGRRKRQCRCRWNC